MRLTPAGSRAWRVARILAAATAIAFLVAAFLSTWDRSQGLALPALPALLLAGLVTAAGLVSALIGWTVLLGGAPVRRIASGFLLAQAGKYVPGGLWQVVGQIDAARRAGVPLARATAAFAVFTLLQVATGGLFGATLALASVPAPVRVAAASGAALVALADRRWMTWLLARLRPAALSHLPPRRAIVSAFALLTVSHLAGAVAFVALLAGAGAGWQPAAAAAAIVAWTVGFLALPFPSGLGVREAVLVAALSGRIDPAVVLTAAVAQRLVALVVEGAMILLARLLLAGGPGGEVADGHGRGRDQRDVAQGGG